MTAVPNRIIDGMPGGWKEFELFYLAVHMKILTPL